MKTHWQSFLYLVIGLLLAQTGKSSPLRIELVDVPELQLPDHGIYVATSFNHWTPGDPAYEMEKIAPGHYVIEFPNAPDQFEYKFTQGNWVLVEGDSAGGERNNRTYDRALSSSDTIICRIPAWQFHKTYRFIINKVPERTPHDANLFLVGNFNNWNPGDLTYQAKRQVDGTYRVSLISDLERIEYKFTRGNWASVEGKYGGKVRPNRVLTQRDLSAGDKFYVEIESWEDLSGTFSFFSLYDLLMLFSAFQGVLLVIAIPSIQDYNRKANNWLVLLLGISSLMIFFRVIGFYREVAEVYPKLLLIPDFLMLTYAPVFYFYVERLLFQAARLPRRWWVHFLPLLLQILLYMPFFLGDSYDVKLKILNRDPMFEAIFVGVGMGALLLNSFYWYTIWRGIQHYEEEAQSSTSYEENLSFLKAVLIMQAVCIAMWIVSFFLYAYYYLFDAPIYDLIETANSTIWLFFSSISFLLGYFAIHQPEVFKIHRTESLFGEAKEILLEEARVGQLIEVKVDPQPDDNLQQFQPKLEQYMEEEKPFTNPKLTLHQLAESVDMPPYLLSKVINEGYGKNFFDFVNTYRVEEFIQRAENPTYKDYTLLSIAFDVGFNSKSAFNRSFKKITQLSPTAYLEKQSA
ncbi:MAG: helix-turn-helix domain-containing protein [Bacteroidota bacterium]